MSGDSNFEALVAPPEKKKKGGRKLAVVNPSATTVKKSGGFRLKKSLARLASLSLMNCLAEAATMQQIGETGKKYYCFFAHVSATDGGSNDPAIGVQEKTTSIFCVEDKALFCFDRDKPVHSAGSLAANHQRFLAIGIRVALTYSSTQEPKNNQHDHPPPPATENNMETVVPQVVPVKTPTHQTSGYSSPQWAIDDLLQISDFESSDKVVQSRKLIQRIQTYSIKICETGIRVIRVVVIIVDVELHRS
ncbi:hypothetical protein Tco_0420670 [Tanacetum coccineum]